MITVSGTITNIGQERNQQSGNDKTVVTIESKRETCFVEFRSESMMKKIKEFKVDDRVTVKISLEGHISTRSGVRYNNLICKSITPEV